MANDPFLGMLGLTRRAGKLAFGDELVREMCLDKKARAVFVAADAGASTAKKAAFYAETAGVPCITLPHGKEELGAAIGKNGCAVCAVGDIGLAAAALQKLAAAHGEYAAAAAQMAEKNARIQSRRGRKKPRNREAQPAAGQPAENPSRKPGGSRPQRASSRPTSQRSANGKRPHGTGSRFSSQRKPGKNPRAKRV